MGQILEFVGHTLVQALPTFLIVFFLYFYLRRTFFNPLGEVLDKRRQATQGAVERAEALVAKAAEKAAGYEQALADARAEIFKENETLRKQLETQQSATLDRTRQQAAATVAAARADLAQQAAGARASLEAESERLAELIASAIISGRAA